jgi:hypothetical protein
MRNAGLIMLGVGILFGPQATLGKDELPRISDEKKAKIEEIRIAVRSQILESIISCQREQLASFKSVLEQAKEQKRKVLVEIKESEIGRRKLQ